jgi:hypothetical protein
MKKNSATLRFPYYKLSGSILKAQIEDAWSMDERFSGHQKKSWLILIPVFFNHFVIVGFERRGKKAELIV